MKNKKTETILNYLKTTGMEISARDIASHLGYGTAEVSIEMSRAFKAGAVSRVLRKIGRHHIYFYRAIGKKHGMEQKTAISLSERIALMDAPVFAAVKRRQEASCKV